MLEKIKEIDVWQKLKNDNKPIAIYGMGDGAEKIISTLNSYGVDEAEIFASDEFVRGHSFLGHKVLKYSEVCQKYNDFNIVLAFATHIDNMLEKIKEMNMEHPVFAPDVPVAGSGLFTTEYIKSNEEKFDKAYSLLADEESKKVFVDILNFKVSGKVDYLFGSFCNKNEIYKNILKLSQKETIVDLGAYDGDTIREFTDFTNCKYKKIIALEPDEKNFKKLSKNTNGMSGIELYNMGAWSKKDTLFFAKKAGRNSKLSANGTQVEVTDIDSIINEEVTMIKMDIEGAEMEAIKGAESTIKSYLPKLYICAYHRNEDLFSIPLKINELSKNYKIYFRHSPYIPAWETNFYAVSD